MKFELNEQQRMIRNMVAEFAQRELAPRAAEIDKSEEFPWDAVKKMGALNLMGMPFPSGVRLLGEKWADEVPSMWGINGLTTVLGSIGAMILAMTQGFFFTLTIGSLFYLWIGLIFWKWVVPRT